MGTSGCVAMILAGGRGKRLGALTSYYPKPAIHFGGSNRIIDFTLCNCVKSGLDAVGILSQYFSADLHAYVSAAYSNPDVSGSIHMLPSQSNENFYTGTADAVCKNIGFIERFQPEHVLVLSGDHIYRMDYGKFLECHIKNGADATMSSTPVSVNEGLRFGLLRADRHGRVCHFDERPRKPKSGLASMGVYAFRWDALRAYLIQDAQDPGSRHDFGENILPMFLADGRRVFAYRFDGYWRDVGTVDSLWEANMYHLDHPEVFDLSQWGTDPRNRADASPFGMSRGAALIQSIASAGCSILGSVKHSVLGAQVTIGKDSEIVDSVIMPGAYIGNNVKIYKAVVGPRASIMDNSVIGAEKGSDSFLDLDVCTNGVSLVAPWAYIAENMCFRSGSHIHRDSLIPSGRKREAAKRDHLSRHTLPVCR